MKQLYQVDGGRADPLRRGGVHTVEDLRLAGLHHVLPDRRHRACSNGQCMQFIYPRRLTPDLPDVDSIGRKVSLVCPLDGDDVGAGGRHRGKVLVHAPRLPGQALQQQRLAATDRSLEMHILRVT